MRTRYTDEALGDVEQILTYIAKRSIVAADIVSFTIERTVDRVGSFPYSAQATDEAGVRMTPVGRFPYLLFYTVAKDELWILRVRHAARLRP